MDVANGGGGCNGMGGAPFLLASPLLSPLLSTEAVRPTVEGAFKS